MIKKVLIFAVGNESRGDDALGPLLVRELDTWLNTHKLSAQFELLEEFQLQVENAMDMHERDLVLFVDAGMNTHAPFYFSRATPNDAPVLYSHALEPIALLKVYQQFYKVPPPPVFILCISGESYELGEPLGAKAQQHLAAALEFAKKLAEQPEVDIWNAACTVTMEN